MNKIKLMLCLIVAAQSSLLFSNQYQDPRYQNKSYQQYKSGNFRNNQVAQNSEYDNEPTRIYPVERGSSSDTTPESVEDQSRGYIDPNQASSSQQQAYNSYKQYARNPYR